MFNRKADMNVHVRIHDGFTEFMPYHCPVQSCRQKFRTKIIFGKHLAMHNSLGVITELTCEIKDCGMTFHGYEEFKLHEAILIQTMVQVFLMKGKNREIFKNKMFTPSSIVYFQHVIQCL